MVKLLLQFLLIFTFISPSLIFAQEDDNAATPLLNSSVIRNPFDSQLPKKIDQSIQEKSPDQTELSIYTAPAPSDSELPPIEVEEPPPPPPIPELVITGVVWNSARPQAIINGEVVDVGQTINGVQILNIEKSGIKVLWHNAIATLIP
jgi:hypothetical protein